MFKRKEKKYIKCTAEQHRVYTVQLLVLCPNHDMLMCTQEIGIVATKLLLNHKYNRKYRYFSILRIFTINFILNYLFEKRPRFNRRIIERRYVSV